MVAQPPARGRLASGSAAEAGGHVGPAPTRLNVEEKSSMAQIPPLPAPRPAHRRNEPHGARRGAAQEPSARSRYSWAMRTWPLCRARSSPSSAPRARASRPFLRCLNLLETPDAGHVWFQGSRTSRPSACGREQAARGHRHGVPGLQPVQQHGRAGQLHAGAGHAEKDASKARGRANRDGASDESVGLAEFAHAAVGQACPAAKSSAWPSRARCA